MQSQSSIDQISVWNWWKDYCVGFVNKLATKARGGEKCAVYISETSPQAIPKKDINFTTFEINPSTEESASQSASWLFKFYAKPDGSRERFQITLKLATNLEGEETGSSIAANTVRRATQWGVVGGVGAGLAAAAAGPATVMAAMPTFAQSAATTATMSMGPTLLTADVAIPAVAGGMTGATAGFGRSVSPPIARAVGSRLMGQHSFVISITVNGGAISVPDVIPYVMDDKRVLFDTIKTPGNARKVADQMATEIAKKIRSRHPPSSGLVSTMWQGGMKRLKDLLRGGSSGDPPTVPAAAASVAAAAPTAGSSDVVSSSARAVRRSTARSASRRQSANPYGRPPPPSS